MNTVGITDFKNQTPLSISVENISNSNISEQMRFFLSNVYQIKGAIFNVLTKKYETLEYKGMKTVGITGITDNTNHTHQSISDGKMSKFNTPKNENNIH